MTPAMQQFRHDPPRAYGDCHAAALASVLDLPLEAVPHFMDGLGPHDGDEFRARQDRFLQARGLIAIVIPFVGDLRDVMATVAAQTPDVYYLLGGASRNGFGHTVVCLNDRIVHDPHPDSPGIVGPMDDGMYWLTFLGSAALRAAP